MEEILLKECKNSKKTRESVIYEIFKNYESIAKEVLIVYDLKRANDKYVLKIRAYDENSYSKQKIRYEELLFIRKSYLMLKMSESLKEHIRLKQMSNVITDFVREDSEMLTKDFYLYEMLFKKFFSNLK